MSERADDPRSIVICSTSRRLNVVFPRTISPAKHSAGRLRGSLWSSTNEVFISKTPTKARPGASAEGMVQLQLGAGCCARGHGPWYPPDVACCGLILIAKRADWSWLNGKDHPWLSSVLCRPRRTSRFCSRTVYTV